MHLSRLGAHLHCVEHISQSPTSYRPSRAKSRIQAALVIDLNVAGRFRVREVCRKRGLLVTCSSLSNCRCNGREGVLTGKHLHPRRQVSILVCLFPPAASFAWIFAELHHWELIVMSASLELGVHDETNLRSGHSSSW